MEEKVADFLQALQDETYVATSSTTTFDKLNDDPESVMADSIAFAQKQLAAGKLIQTRVDITGFHDVEMNVRLESSLINLPFAYANEIDKMLDPDDEREVNLYMIFDSPAINVSKMRIDMASSVQAFLDDPDSVSAKITDWLREQVEKLETADAEKEAED
ncbi:hypothetical protein [Furfurilactobacillus rossiae]|uniref:Uncharacterized protein n=1 Tax=Furfurilactobacillus rossiae DSM 15814 TaxID=1114972 RepID=A0A0R1R9X4_9LACO|nr:hypothetical protein [Furfurilactobacillus rossiae]KRL53839.1 hypothetical protein FD35_GL000805 [Furfurilactobacillus rossiae DSM 15814]QFR66824.1 hypothetical protein LR814_06810 [Furfurilactobacillus rossiae]QLE62310.1 hypothetical protein LROSRS0_2265 [Furfurilactobacillus rossiae]